MTLYFDYDDYIITFAILFRKPHTFFSIGLGKSMVNSDIWGFSV
jgi:hypothetical protein